MDDDWIEVSRSETVLFIQYRFFLCKILKLMRYINMIVLTTDIEQTFSIIPIYQQDPINSGNAFMMEFTNETTKEVFTVQASSIAYIFDYIQLTSTALTFLKENTFYNLKVYFQNSNTITYKDRVICTNQSIDTFSINNGEYTLPNIDNNNYITI